MAAASAAWARSAGFGNSVKSDVNPALAVGMGAVFIPNDDIWALEHAELDPVAPRLLQLERFGQLASHF